MSEKNQNKKILIETIAANWGISIRETLKYLNAFKNQKTKSCPIKKYGWFWRLVVHRVRRAR